MTPFVHDSSSSATGFNRHENGKMNGDSVSEDRIPTKMNNGESNEPSYFKTLQEHGSNRLPGASEKMKA